MSSPRSPYSTQTHGMHRTLTLIKLCPFFFFHRLSLF